MSIDESMFSLSWGLAQHSFEILSAIATVLSVWALLRTYLLTRPHLRLLQQKLWGKNYIGWRDTDAAVGITVLVTNPRPQANAIISWAARIEGSDGQSIMLSVPSMELQITSDQTTHCGVVPLTVSAFGAVEAHLAILGLPKEISLPLRLKITARDLFQKTYALQCEITRDHALGGQPTIGQEPTEWKLS